MLCILTRHGHALHADRMQACFDVSPLYQRQGGNTTSIFFFLVQDIGKQKKFPADAAGSILAQPS